MRIAIFPIISLLIFSSCYRSYGRAPYVDSTEVIQEVTESSLELSDQHDLHLMASSLSRDENGGVDELYLEYISQEIIELKDARHLLVDVVDNVLKHINNVSVPEEMISEYPIIPENLHIHIHFETFFGVYNDPYFIERIILKNGLVHFYAFTAFNCTHDIWDFHLEPYSTTVTIVDTENAYKERKEAIAELEAQMRKQHIEELSAQKGTIRSSNTTIVPNVNITPITPYNSINVTPSNINVIPSNINVTPTNINVPVSPYNVTPYNNVNITPYNSVTPYNNLYVPPQNNITPTNVTPYINTKPSTNLPGYESIYFNNPNQPSTLQPIPTVQPIQPVEPIR